MKEKPLVYLSLTISIIAIAYAAWIHWDLSTVYLCDPKTGTILCRLYPQDKTKNAEGLRAPKTPGMNLADPVAPGGMAPLLQKIITQCAATGLPPAYLPKHENQNPA